MPSVPSAAIPQPTPPSEKWLRRILQGIVLGQILIVGWDAIALMEKYGIRRVQADCGAYLSAARSLAQGHSLKTVSLFEPLPYGWMSDWPLGYPVLIAAAFKLTGLEPFYASRWLNIALFASTYLLLLYFFREKAEWLFLWIYPPNYTWNVTYALSENLFIPVLVAFVGAFYRYYQRAHPLWLGIAGVTLVGLFLTRYAGIAIGGALFLYGMLRLAERQWKETLRWSALAIAQGLFAAGYFLWNAVNHPAGETGLHIRDMPMPEGFWGLVWKYVPYVKFIGLVGAFTGLVWLWRRRDLVLDSPERRLHQLFLLLFLTQAGLYLWSMWRGRVGIIDMRHFVIMALPLIWYWADILWRLLPRYATLGIAVVFLLWQIRNTYRHTRWAYEKEFVPYSYVEEVRQAYDTLPPGACIIGGSLVYPIKGTRTDLCMGDAAAYFPILLRDCSCLYIECGLLEERLKLGFWGGIFWPFVKFCDKPCKDRVCLKKIHCASSPRTNSDASR